MAHSPCHRPPSPSHPLCLAQRSAIPARRAPPDRQRPAPPTCRRLAPRPRRACTGQSKDTRSISISTGLCRPPSGHQHLRWRLRTVLHAPCSHRGRTHCRQGGRRIRIAEFVHQSHHLRKVVPVQRLGRHSCEIRPPARNSSSAPVSTVPRQRQHFPSFIKGHAQAAPACRSLTGALAGPVSKASKARPVLLRPISLRGSTHSQVANAPKVQKSDRLFRLPSTWRRQNEKTAPAAPLAAQLATSARAKVPDHRHVPATFRPAPHRHPPDSVPCSRGAWASGLTVKANQINAPELRPAAACMRRHRSTSVAAASSLGSGPMAQRLRASTVLFLCRVCSVVTCAEAMDLHAIGLHHSCIHPVQRRARHRAQRPLNCTRFCPFHRLSDLSNMGLFLCRRSPQHIPGQVRNRRRSIYRA